MELLSVFKAENQRQYLSQLLPGSVALWPFPFILMHVLEFKLDTNHEWLIVLVAFVYLFIASGLGVLIEDIGSLFELRLEHIYFELRSRQRAILKDWNHGLNIRSLIVSIFKHSTAVITIFIPDQRVREWLLGCHLNQKSATSPTEARKTFYENWEKYLGLTFKTGDEPVALRYYRSVLIRFKFELNMSAALVIMLGGHFVLFLVSSDWDLLSIGRTALYLSIIGIIVSILIVEAFKMIELLDEIRCKLTKISNSQ